MTFAGSPDRVESRLVPEAGFELDTFEISGFPRKPSLELVRSLVRAAKAPFACRAILRRRRPDVVLGGGGYVAGPMVLAARLSRIPAALTEADAHLGLANRLAAPFASKLFLAYDIEGRDGEQGRGRRPPDSHRPPGREPGRCARPLRHRCRCAGRRRVRRARRSDARSTRWRSARGATEAPPCCTSPASATTPRSPRGCTGRLPADAAHRPLRRCPRRRRRRRLAGGRDRVGARRCRHAVDPGAVSPRHRRPPDAERAPLRARWRRHRRAERRDRVGAGARRVAARGSRPARRDAHGDARHGPRGCGRPDRRGGYRPCRAS